MQSEGSLDVDIPFRDIGFQGVPFRTNVLLQPTTECLVHLTDPPFLVVTITDIEIAHLERVQVVYYCLSFFSFYLFVTVLISFSFLSIVWIKKFRSRVYF